VCCIRQQYGVAIHLFPVIELASPVMFRAVTGVCIDVQLLRVFPKLLRCVRSIYFVCRAECLKAVVNVIFNHIARVRNVTMTAEVGFNSRPMTEQLPVHATAIVFVSFATGMPQVLLIPHSAFRPIGNYPVLIIEPADFAWILLLPPGGRWGERLTPLVNPDYAVDGVTVMNLHYTISRRSDPRLPSTPRTYPGPEVGQHSGLCHIWA